jgi:deoxycytidylate deaminase
MQILGDTITEESGRMIASVFNGDIQAIKNLVENTELDEFARGQGIHAMVILALHER